MKNFLFVFLITFSCYSQSNSYQIQYKSVSQIPNLASRTSLYELIVFNEMSYFIFRPQKSITLNEPIAEIKRFQIIKDFGNGKMYETTKFGTIIDSLKLINWKYLQGEKNILNYSCKKAVGTFRGRNYTAYYSEKIPISNGPYKFNGLPGLIMEISSDDKFIKFEASQIRFYEGEPIVFPSNWLNKLISFETFKNLEEEDLNLFLKKEDARLSIENQGKISTTVKIESIQKY